MGVYNNNKDGTRSTLANTIQVVDAPMEQFVSRGEFSAVTPSDVSADNKLVAENEVIKAVDTMPSTAELRAMPNNTYFRTKGYYSPTDGHGGFYSKNNLWIPGSYEIPKINDSDPRVWITCLDNPNNHIDLSKYGLRECPSKILEFNRPTDIYMGSTTSLPTASASTENQVYEYTGNTVDPSPKKGYFYRCESTTTTVEGQNITTYLWAEYQFYTTPENTYATANSDLFDKLYFTRMGSVFTIGAGKYFFERPIDLAARNNGLKGDSAPYVWVPNQTTRGDFSSGTVLYFPFLTNGQTAIRTYWSSISDLAIYGNPYIYDLDITRGAVDPSTGEMTSEPHVAETIAMDGANEIRCTGLNPHSGIIQNVYVNNFYTGIDVPTCNAELQSVFSRKCRNGVVIGNDVKCRGVFGWYTHTLLTFTGAIASAVQVRGDSLIHLINIQNGAKITISDADGDWCAKELVVIGKENGRYGEVTGLRLNDVHGRCCGLNFYDSNALPNGRDVRDLSDIDGYGTIRILPNTAFKDSYISVNNVGGNLIDGNSRYKCTNIMFTQNTAGVIQGIHFAIPSLRTKDDVLRIVQTKTGFLSRLDSAYSTFFIENSNVKDSVDPSTDIDFSTLLGGD